MALRVSVIVLAWNGEAFLEACLTSVREQDYPGVELIVVDNASTDDSVRIAERHCPPAHLIRNSANLGYAGGNNVGLRQASGDVVLLLNQDVQLRPGCVRAFAQAFERAQTGIVGGKAYFPDGRVQHAGGWIEWPSGLAHHHGYQAVDQGQWSEPRPVEFVTGAALAIRRAVMERVGLLDEGFWPGYFEDVDYCLRAARAGFEIWFAPEAALVHAESPSTDQARRSRFYQSGRLRLVLKHLSPDRFLDAFVPAEVNGQAAAIAGGEGPALREAYLGVMPGVPCLLRDHWKAGPVQAHAVVAALRDLYTRAWQVDLRSLSGPQHDPADASARLALDLGSEGLNNLVQVGAADLLPDYVRLVQTRKPGGQPAEAGWLELKEYAFRSSLPLIGPVVTWMRQLWYGIAARWAMLYFMQQQEAINRRQAMVELALAQRVQAVAEELSLLAARLAQPLESTSEEGPEK